MGKVKKGHRQLGKRKDFSRQTKEIRGPELEVSLCWGARCLGVPGSEGLLPEPGTEMHASGA